MKINKIRSKFHFWTKIEIKMNIGFVLLLTVFACRAIWKPFYWRLRFWVVLSVTLIKRLPNGSRSKDTVIRKYGRILFIFIHSLINSIQFISATNSRRVWAACALTKGCYEMSLVHDMLSKKRTWIQLTRTLFILTGILWSWKAAV